MCSQGPLRALNAFIQRGKDDDEDYDDSDNETPDFDEEAQYETIMSQLPFCEYESMFSFNQTRSSY